MRKLLVALLSISLTVVTCSVSANSKDCDWGKPVMGPAAFAGLNFGDDPSAAYCKLKALDVRDNSDLTLHVGLDSIIGAPTYDFTVAAKDHLSKANLTLNGYIWSLVKNLRNTSASGFGRELVGKSDVEIVDAFSARTKKIVDEEKNIGWPQRRLIALQGVDSDFPGAVLSPDTYWTFTLTNLYISGIPFTLELNFKSGGPMAVKLLAERLRAGSEMHKYFEVDVMPIYDGSYLNHIHLSHVQPNSGRPPQNAQAIVDSVIEKYCDSTTKRTSSGISCNYKTEEGCALVRLDGLSTDLGYRINDVSYSPTDNKNCTKSKYLELLDQGKEIMKQPSHQEDLHGVM